MAIVKLSTSPEDFTTMKWFDTNTNAWFAIKDWRRALLTLLDEGEPGNVTTACVFFQQAVEKFLRYIFVLQFGEQEGYTDKHRLLPLAKRIGYPHWEVHRDVLGKLVSIYYTGRYTEKNKEILEQMTAFFEDTARLEEINQVAKELYTMAWDVQSATINGIKRGVGEVTKSLQSGVKGMHLGD